MTNFVITPKWVLLVITLIRASAGDTHGIERRDTNGEQKKVVCYYTNWSVYRPGTAKFTPHNINPYLCTHLIYAFGGLDKENGLRPYDKYQDIEQGGFAKFTGLKTYNKNLKTMLAIGGWNEGSARFSNLVADEERRAALVKNGVKFLRQNNFDGLDLDWEYPAFRDGSKAVDKENYASLVKELRDEFERESSKTGRPRLLLTMAVPAGVEYIDKGYDIPKLNKYLDFMNILSYDYHSAYEPNVNHHAPLYSIQEESEYNFDAQLTIDYTIKHYLEKGADPEKLVLGIPTYGRSYTLFNNESTDLGSPADGPGEQGEATREKGYLAYYEICINIANNDEWKEVQPKKSVMGPYAYRGNQWVGYDDVDIVKLKAKYVNEKGLGGIMYWSIDNDDFRGKCLDKPYPLIEAGKAELLSNSGNSANTIISYKEEKQTKLGNRENRPKYQTTTTKPQTTTSKKTTMWTTINPLSTPEPPTTPDPGTDFVCKEDGFFPHPRDCKKYFWCLDSGPSNLGIVAHQFTCPSGLMFNKATDSCDYSRNVICNKISEKSTTTTTTARSTTARSGLKSTTTSTTTTTELPFKKDKEEEEEEDIESQEDPKAIKQLINLIKKLGGINELEKQLKIDADSQEATTPAISKSLYNKVFISPSSNRYRGQHRNAPPGPQNGSLPPADDKDVPYRKDKLQYVTIQRSRPLKTAVHDAEDSGTTNNKSLQPIKDSAYIGNDEEEDSLPLKYTPSTRSRSSTKSRPTTPRYVVLQRSRPDRLTPVDEEEAELDSPTSTTHRYITLVRNKPSTAHTKVNELSHETSTRASPQMTNVSAERPRDKQITRIGGKFQHRDHKVLPSRSKLTTISIATTEDTFTESSKLNSRFRRRKGRPENRSINTARTENFLPLAETKTATVTRHKNYDISLRGSSIVSDYLPIPKRLLKSNETNYDQLYADNLNLEDLESQTIKLPRKNYNLGDVSDLADSAVVAITNLKTLSPTSPQVTYPRTMTVAPQTTYIEESMEEQSQPKLISITKTTASPFFQHQSTVRTSNKRTTTQVPSLQDVYNDYQETDAEYHAEPVEIPITGKVRIHSDGYIECLDMGNFPHPFSCRKFISCAKMDYDSLLGWEYTCPKGLSFDPIGGICNWAAGLGCKD